MRGAVFVVSMLVLVGCSDTADGGPAAPGEGVVDEAPPELPDALFDESVTAPIGLLFPELPGVRVEDHQDTDLVAALDDANIRFEETRQRLLLDAGGNTTARVEAVTFPPGSGPADFAFAWFGAAPRAPLDVAGVTMSLVERPPGQGHPVVFWEGPTFVVMFGVAQELPELGAIDVAAATLKAMA